MTGAPARARTLVCFHAHPDDESLLTGGTMARAAAEGHRVVLVVATGGEAGLTEPVVDSAELGRRRRDEVVRAADALGVARLIQWAYPDSGSDPDRTAVEGFCHRPVEEVAQRLAGVLREEHADVLTSYDPSGGYGHPDHLQVHRVGRRAAELTGTPLLEATVDRDLLQRVLRLVAWLPGLPSDFAADRFAAAYRPGSEITHRIDVRRHCGAKRAAMAAHASQARGGRDDRTLQVLLRLPRPLFRLVLGREWYVEPGRQLGDVRASDVFASRPAVPR